MNVETVVFVHCRYLFSIYLLRVDNLEIRFLGTTYCACDVPSSE